MGQREISRDLRVSLSTVQLWLSRSQAGHYEDRPSGRAWNRTGDETESLVLSFREQLKLSALGEIGAQAIHREFAEHGIAAPSVRTIGRILSRTGALTAKPRRRPPAPKGWYLPDVASRSVELDQFDAVTGLVIKGGTDVEVLNGVSLHGGLIGSWPEPSVTAASTLESLLGHWRTFGLPAYAQFDNDTRFQGPHQHKDALGSVVRMCLSLGVTPVFAPPREPGFQAGVESLNGLWQAKVWGRYQHADLEDLRQKSHSYVLASRKRHAMRIEAAPVRTPFPQDWKREPKPPLIGRVVFLRRADEQGRVSLLGRVFSVETLRPHRLVRTDVLYEKGCIQFFGLRRTEPGIQTLLRQTDYAPTKRP